MYTPPPDSPSRPPFSQSTFVQQPTWTGIFVSYGMMAALPLVLWVVSRPLAGAVVLSTMVGLFIATRYAYRLVRCFYECQEFVFDLTENVRITVAQVPANDPN